jgi:hypothetical protein
MNFTDPIAEIPHPHLITSPVSEVLIFYCAFLTLNIVTVTTLIFSEFNMTVLHSAEGTVCKTPSKCSANNFQASIMFYDEYYNTTN